MLQKTTVTVAQNGTLSGAGEIEGGLLVEVQLPTIDGTAFSLSTSWDRVTYQPVYDKLGLPFSFTGASGKNVNVAPDQIVTNSVKVLMATSQTSAAINIGLVYLTLDK